MADTIPNKSEDISHISLNYIRIVLLVMGVTPYEWKQPHPHFWAHLLRRLLVSLQLPILLAAICYMFMQNIRCQQNPLNNIYHTWDLLSYSMDYLAKAILYTSHCVIQFENAWKASRHYQQVQEKCVKMQRQFVEQFHQTACEPVERVRQYSRRTYALAALYFFVISMFNVLIPLITNLGPSFMLAVYSEIVIKLKIFEFLLSVIIVLVIQRQLVAAAEQLVDELNLRRPDGAAEAQHLCRLNGLRDLHGQLWSLARLICNYFEYSLPILVLKGFVDLTLYCYWIFMNVVYGLGHSILIIYCFTTLPMQLVVFLAGFCMCSVCEKWDKRTRSIYRNISTDRSDLVFNVALRSVSLQMSHEHISFSAGGFLVLNRNTLAHLAMSMMAFVVILIQFRLSVEGD